MKKTLVLILGLAFGLYSPAFSQEMVLEGYVLDAQTQAAVPYAHISVEGSTLGTTTNAEGRFILKIPQNWAARELLVSFIGYETYQQKINTFQDVKKIRVLLRESSLNLSQITVTAESPAQIVAKAYNQISVNFPLENTLYTGFYRESYLHKKEDETEAYVYVIEAVTKINKPSYEKRNPEGDIKLLQVRKNKFMEGDNFGKWIAGAFTPMRFDVAKKRFDFINPSTQDRYEYTLKDYATYYDRVVYVIAFQPAKNTADYEGLIYIDNETYTIVKVDYQYSEKGLIRENANRSQHSILDKRQFKINYQPINNKWYIESVWQQAIGEDKLAKKPFRYTTEYATTQIDINTYEAFEYGDKIQWGEVFLTKNTAYKEDFWQNFNIVAETKSLKENLIDTTYQAKIALELSQNPLKDKPTATILKNKKIWIQPVFHLISPYLLANGANQMRLNYLNEDNSLVINQSFDSNNTQLAWSSGFGLEAVLSNRWLISAITYAGVGKLGINGFDVSLGYLAKLSQANKRPFYLTLGLDYAWAGLTKRVAILDNPANARLNIEGKTFEDKKLRAELFQNFQALKPKLGFQLEINRSLRAFVEGGCLLALSYGRSGMRFRERSRGLLGDKQEVGFANDRLNLVINNQTTNRLPFGQDVFFNIGLKGSF